jgi:hypothetical protein
VPEHFSAQARLCAGALQRAGTLVCRSTSARRHEEREAKFSHQTIPFVHFVVTTVAGPEPFQNEK